MLPRASQKAPWPPSFYGNLPHEAHLLHKLSLLFGGILRRVSAVIVDPDPTLHLAFPEAKIHDFK